MVRVRSPYVNKMVSLNLYPIQVLHNAIDTERVTRAVLEQFLINPSPLRRNRTLHKGDEQIKNLYSSP